MWEGGGEGEEGHTRNSTDRIPRATGHVSGREGRSGTVLEHDLPVGVVHGHLPFVDFLAVHGHYEPEALLFAGLLEQRTVKKTII